MHSSLVRAQNVFGFFTTVAFVIAALTSLSIITFPQKPTAEINLRNVQVVKGRPHYYSTKKEEYAHIKFDLDADLSSLFNWNTKQVFVWITAKWPSPKAGAPPSEAVIWDQIIPADPAQNPNLALERRKSKTKPATKEERGKISLRNQKGKYQVTDMAGKLAEYGNATLELGWNVQPWVGPLTWTNRVGFGTWEALKGGKSGLFDFPALKPKKVVVSEGGSSTKA